MYTSDRELYLDDKGNVVEADDPNRLTLIASKGGKIPMEDARRHGLIADPGEAAQPATPPQRTNDPALEIARPGAARSGQKKA